MKFGDVFIEDKRGFFYVRVYIGIAPFVLLYLTDCNDKVYLREPEVCRVLSLIVVNPTKENIISKIEHNNCTYARCSLDVLSHSYFNIEHELKCYMLKKQLQDGERPTIIEDRKQYAISTVGEKFALLASLKKGHQYRMKFDDRVYTYLGYKYLKKSDKVDTLPSFIRDDGFVTVIGEPVCTDEERYDKSVEDERYKDYYDYGMLKDKYKDWNWYL